MFDDVEFLNDSSQWPGNGCLCCVKRYHIDANIRTALNGRVFANESGVPIPTVHLHDNSTEEYGSMQELVAAGWMVD